MATASDLSRKLFQRKKAIKGHKSIRGCPELYDNKKSRFYFKLTETTAGELNRIAEEFDISRSELIERIGREIIKLKYKRNQPTQNYSSKSNKIRCVALTLSAAQSLEKIARKRTWSAEELLERIGHSLVSLDRQ
jgi:predicted DNA-binding ribbon-helix-helix protein